MTVTSTARGHPTYYYGHVEKYTDTQVDAKISRPCIKCKHHPTVEGYDHCLGYIEGIRSACCGHGVEPSHIVLWNGLRLNSRFNLDELKTQL